MVDIQKKRITSIDAFRGLTMILMVYANLCGRLFAPVFSHSVGIPGFTLVDLIEPMFYFAIALTYKLSFDRKVESIGLSNAVYSFINRNLALIGLGFLISLSMTPEGYSFGDFLAWGTLQSIGLSGLIALPFVKVNRYVRLSFGVVLIAVFQVLLMTGEPATIIRTNGDTGIIIGEFTKFADTIYNSVNDNLVGTLPKAGMLLMGISMVEIYRTRPKKEFLICFFSLLAISVASAFIFPISQRILSASYALVSLTLSIAIYMLMEFIFDKKSLKCPPLLWWGRNSILIYALNQTLGFAVLFGDNALLRFVSITIWALALTAMAFFLDKKRWYIKL